MPIVSMGPLENIVNVGWGNYWVVLQFGMGSNGLGPLLTTFEFGTAEVQAIPILILPFQKHYLLKIIKFPSSGTSVAFDTIVNGPSIPTDIVGRPLEGFPVSIDAFLYNGNRNKRDLTNVFYGLKSNGGGAPEEITSVHAHTKALTPATCYGTVNFGLTRTDITASPKPPVQFS